MRTDLLLVGKAKEVLAVWFPRDDVRAPWTQLWILLVTRYLPSLKPKTGVDTKRLVVEVSEKKKQY